MQNYPVVKDLKETDRLVQVLPKAGSQETRARNYNASFKLSKTLVNTDFSGCEK